MSVFLLIFYVATVNIISCYLNLIHNFKAFCFVLSVIILDTLTVVNNDLINSIQDAI